MALLSALLAGSLPACNQGQRPQRQVVGHFAGSFDAETGTLTMNGAPAGPRPRLQASVVSVNDVPGEVFGGPGIGHPGTVELVTEGSVRSGALPAAQGGCGRADSICADVTVRSFFATNELHNVFVELTSVSSATNHGFWNTAIPTGIQPGTGQVTSVNGGLWAYPALLDSTRGDVSTGSAPGANAATRTWYFNNPGNTSFTFAGRVMADGVPTTIATGLQGLCGTSPGTPTSLDTIVNCGECGRTAPGGSTCAYANLAGTSQATARLDSAVTCGIGTACDTDVGGSRAFSCRNLLTDTANCGVCGNVCGTGNDCAAGVCTTSGICPPSTAPCGTICCPAGSTCTVGLCILSDATEVAVGAQHACAATASTRLPTLTSSGTPTTPNNVVCWGQSWWNDTLLPGDLFNPIWTRGTALPEFIWVVDGRLDHLAAGGTMSGGLVAGGADMADFWAWGTLWNTNPLDGSKTDGGGLSVAVGGGHVCLLETTSVWCSSDDNTLGQLGNGTTTLVMDNGFFPHVVPVDGNAADNVMTGTPGARFLVATQASAGGDTTCAVLSAPVVDPAWGLRGADQVEGTVACWGDNATGKAGAPVIDPTHYLVPRLVRLTSGGSALGGAIMVSVGGRHAVALIGSGALAFWGQNARGQFGDGTTAAGALVTLLTPAHVPVTSIAAGQDFTCYTSGGKVYCAGANDRGQLGDGTVTDRHAFVEVAGVIDASTVRAGGVPKTGNQAHGGACATAGGNVFCWGDNTTGQVGAGTSSGFYTTPRLVQLQPVPRQ